jgi:hypothetical protein
MAYFAARPARATRWLTLLPLLAIALPGDAQVSVAPVSTARAAEAVPWVGGDWVAFLQPEEDRDLNGDGDTDDSVLQVANVTTRQISNLGLAVDASLAGDDLLPPVAIAGGTLAALVSEADQGKRDLNGDNDTTDTVLETVDLASRRVTRIGLAGSEVRMDGNRIVVLTPEAAQANRDLNGDNDTADQVLQVYDVGTQQTWNTQVVAASFLMAGDWAAATTPEAGQGGQDLNQDSDTADSVAVLLDLKTRKVTNTGLESAYSSALTPRLLAVAVEEARQGNHDLNGDNDTADAVLQVINLATMEAINTAQDASGDVVADGGLVAFVTEESRQKNADLNGDRDAVDAVGQVFDLATKQVTNTRQDSSEGILIGGGAVALLTSEEAQGARDLNGDRDTDDLVIQIYNVAKRSLNNLHFAGGTGFAFTGDLLAFSVPEADQGERDLNGDRDSDDEVVYIYDAAASKLMTTRTASFDVISASPRAAAFFCSESDQGERDLNGDRDTDDDVCLYYRLK